MTPSMNTFHCSSEAKILNELSFRLRTSYESLIHKISPYMRLQESKKFDSIQKNLP